MLAACLLVLIFGFERFAPRAPAPLVAVALTIAASGLLNLADAGVATVGSIPSGLPTLVPPRLDLVREMWPAAAGIALMSFTETIAAARAFGKLDEPRPIPNQELLAVGIGNVAGGLLGAMAAGGGTTQTAVNRKAGARTQVAELVTAAAALATLLLLASVIALMPQAALAAVVVAYSIDLIKPAEFGEIRGVRSLEFRWSLIASAGVVVLGTLNGIVVAVIVSLLALAQQAYNPPVYAMGRKRGTQVFRALSTEHPDDETWSGLLILRTEGRLFFANAQRVADKMRPLIEQAKPTVELLIAAPSPTSSTPRSRCSPRPRRSSAGTASPCGSRRSTPRHWPSCSSRASARDWAASGCSSTCRPRSRHSDSSAHLAPPSRQSSVEGSRP